MIVFGHLGAADTSLKHKTLKPNKVNVIFYFYLHIADMKQYLLGMMLMVTCCCIMFTGYLLILSSGVRMLISATAGNYTE